MTKYCMTIAFAMLFAGVAFGQAAERFVANLGELPLMPGLVEQTEKRLIYEKPEGRIVSAVAVGTPVAAAIMEFYAETLPELGWRKLSETVYRREKEILRLTITTFASQREVQYKIAPE